MPLRNRVLPDGTLAAIDARGTMTGNRGILHDAAGNVGPALWKHRAWVCCELRFRGRWRPPMPPGRWTALFFLDEAVAMAAGHRPCGECRRADYMTFSEAWGRAFSEWPGPKAADAVLHESRAVQGARRLRSDPVRWRGLPPGAMFRAVGEMFLKHPDGVLRFTPEGYRATSGPTEEVAETLTCPALRAVLSAGYRPRLHPSAGGRDGSGEGAPPPDLGVRRLSRPS